MRAVFISFRNWIVSCIFTVFQHSKFEHCLRSHIRKHATLRVNVSCQVTSHNLELRTFELATATCFQRIIFLYVISRCHCFHETVQECNVFNKVRSVLPSCIKVEPSVHSILWTTNSWSSIAQLRRLNDLHLGEDLALSCNKLHK